MIRNERKKKNKKNKNEDDDYLKLAFVLSSASFQEAPFDSSLSLSSSFFLSQRRRRGGRENEKPYSRFLLCLLRTRRPGKRFERKREKGPAKIPRVRFAEKNLRRRRWMMIKIEGKC